MRLDDERRFAGVARGVCGWQSLSALAMAGLLALFGVSVLQGRTHPRRGGSPATPLARSLTVTSSASKIRRAGGSIRWRGGSKRVHLPEGDELHFAGASPWRDERGRWQVVGRVGSFFGDGERQVGDRLHPDALRVPGGAVLDRVATERLPASAPCWEPGTSARVVFAAGDGQLYRGSTSNPPTRRGLTPCEGVRRPEPLSWAVPQPGLGRLEAARPDLAGRSEAGRAAARRAPSPGAGRGPLAPLVVAALVVAAGPRRDGGHRGRAAGRSRPLDVSRLGGMGGSRPEPLWPGPAAPWPSPTCPIARAPTWANSTSRPLRIDPATGDPSAEARGPIRGGDCLRTPPAPSPTAGGFGCVVRPVSSGPRVIRLDLNEMRRLPPDEISD